MRNTRRVQRWGIVAAMAIGLGIMSGAEARTNDVMIKMANIPLSQLVTVLAEESGMRIVMQTDRNPDVSVNFPAPEPVENILSTLAKSNGLDFWKSNETYYIGTRPNIVIDPIPSSPSSVDSTRATVPVAIAPVAPQQARRRAPEPRSIPLKHTRVAEMCYMLGVPNLDGSSFQVRDPQRKQILRNRMNAVTDPTLQSVEVNGGSAYSSPALSSPWLRGTASGSVSRSGSVTDGYLMLDRGYAQANNFPGQYPGSGSGYPGYPSGMGAPRPIPNQAIPGGQMGQPRPTGNTYNTGNMNNTGNNYNNGNLYDEDGELDIDQIRKEQGDEAKQSIFRSQLGDFIPEGIQNIVGLPGMNMLMVKAESDEDIDLLEQFIKKLDQPVKQAIIELMFVEMSVSESMAFGLAWDINAFPLTITNNLGNTGSGPFQMQYQKGNLRAQLAATLANSSGTVVTQPKLLIQNGGSASISLSKSIPIVYAEETTDLAYDVTSTSIKFDSQDISNTFSISDFTIHPDNSMTIDINQTMASPTDAVKVPGSDSSVSGVSTQTVMTKPHIRNGETMLIGAYTVKNEGTASNRTPLLSDIPVIGSLLFKARNKTVSNNDILIFLTATVLEDDTTDFGGISDLPPLF